MITGDDFSEDNASLSLNSLSIHEAVTKLVWSDPGVQYRVELAERQRRGFFMAL